MRRNLSVAAMTRVRDSWVQTRTLAENMRAAGLSDKNERNMRRNKAETQAYFNIELTSQNPQFSDAKKQICPSTLDYAVVRKAKTFVITSAVNNCNLEESFLAELIPFCAKYDAELLIIPLRYRNPSTAWSQKDLAWDTRIYPYALNKDILVNKHFKISRFPTQATAVNPLQGMASLSGSRSCVYGHPQLALETVPTPNDQEAKVIMTSGAITRKNYSDTKAGGQAVFHHSLAATFVKVVGKRIHTTQIHWNGKGFYFLNKYFGDMPDKYLTRETALVMGDEHVECSEPIIQRARKRLVDMLDPDVLVRHDVIDFKWQSHHATRFEKIKMALEGNYLVKEAFDMCVDHVNLTGKGRKNYFAGSNHNDHPDQWLNKFNPDHDPHNAKFAMELGLLKLNTGLPAFEAYLAPRLKVSYNFMSRNKGHLFNGVDIAQHGDKGGNGARGSAAGFSKFSEKTVIGHSHSPKINKGCYQVGVSSKDMDYAQGYSSWAYADCIIQPDGKRNMIFYSGGKSLFDLV